jgi:ubiquinone/menaquinone biosynthesis C-methylase UbiE
MNYSVDEPLQLEINITLGLGLTILSPYYRNFAEGLGLKGDETVMDFGSGSGVCSRHIAARLQKGGHLDCVDISKRWNSVIQKTLKQYNNVSTFLGYINNLDIKKSTYDLIVIHFVLHEIPRIERSSLINNLANILKPEGSLIIREPQDHCLSTNEIKQLAADAQLDPKFIKAHRIAFMSIFDFRLVKTS